MKIGLFDLYSSGHHLPYAEGVMEALTEYTDHETNFITISASERQLDYFDRDDIVYLEPPESAPVEEREGPFSEVAKESISALSSLVTEDNYDIIHFLYIDDILGIIWQYFEPKDDTRLIGDLVGPFFTRQVLSRQNYVHPIILHALQSPLAILLDSAVPDDTPHQALWRDLSLYRCLRRSIFDRMIVHSREAEEYIREFGFNQSVATIPFRVPRTFEESMAKGRARQILGLEDSDTVLLFFGTLRNEKGIDLLLEAISDYSGPEFTMLIAGPPVAVEPIEIEQVNRNPRVDIVTELEFITDSKPYYCAADCVVMPYRRQFGKENMSMIFQEAMGSLRPVIAPDFGVLFRLTKEWDVGLTFNEGSSDALQDAFLEFVTYGPTFSEKQMKEYARRYSYDRTLQRISNLYDELYH